MHTFLEKINIQYHKVYCKCGNSLQSPITYELPKSYTCEWCKENDIRKEKAARDNLLFDIKLLIHMYTNRLVAEGYKLFEQQHEEVWSRHRDYFFGGIYASLELGDWSERRFDYIHKKIPQRVQLEFEECVNKVLNNKK